MSGSERQDDAAPFAHPPQADAGTGSIDVGVDRIVPRAIESAALGWAIAFWALGLGPLGGSSVLTFAAGLLGLGATWLLASSGRHPRRRVTWDAWGVTEETRGVRVSIPWSIARAWIRRSERDAIVRISDDAGRSIACGSGRDLPAWTARSVARREDVERLIAATAMLPRADPPRSTARRRIGPAAAFLASIVGSMAWLGMARWPWAAMVAPTATAVVLAILGAPDASRLRGLATRAWTMRGARPIRLVPGRMAVTEASGQTVPLVVEEAPDDARIADRGEPVRAVLVDRDRGDAYRANARLAARRLEPARARVARWREALEIALRTSVLAAAACVMAIGLAQMSEPEVRREPPPMPSLSRPRPPEPTAWRAPPRAPIVHRAVRATCGEDGTDCHPAITYLDEVGREVFRCETWTREECDRELREAIPDVELEGE